MPVRRGLRAPRSPTTAERYDAPEPINIGAGFEISIRDLAELIAESRDSAAGRSTARSRTASRAAASTVSRAKARSVFQSPPIRTGPRGRLSGTAADPRRNAMKILFLQSIVLARSGGAGQLLTERAEDLCQQQVANGT